MLWEQDSLIPLGDRSLDVAWNIRPRVVHPFGLHIWPLNRIRIIDARSPPMR
jgi:hypothetical protein